MTQIQRWSEAGALIPLTVERGEVWVPLGYELWQDRNQHLLSARLHKAELAGEVARTGQYNITQHGAAWVLIQRVARPRAKAPWYIGATVMAMGSLVALGAMLWHARWVILSVAAGVVVLALLVAHLAGGSARCACVLHGPRCR